jgi:type I restriction enzyme S subunit
LSALDVPIPPIELQNKFSMIVQKVEALREKQNQSTHEIEELFNTLLIKLFKGETIE